MKSTTKSWVITLVGALFFFYAFFQANLMTPLNGSLLKYFGATSSDIGLLSAWFFYANIIFLLPAGLIMDRFSIRILMGINMLLAIAGTLIFAFSDTLFLAAVGRFMSGIMMSFGLIICLKLASLWLPPKNMALASSLIITIGMFGAIAAQAPLAYIVHFMNWQAALLFSAMLGLIIGIILWFTVKDPKGREKEIKESQNISVFTSLYMVFRQKQNWLCGFYISLLNLPVAIFGALFGIFYLIQAYDMTFMHAAAVTSMLFFGMIFGSPFFGWLSDFIRYRKVPMLIGAVACLVLMIIVLYVHKFDLFGLYILFFLIGFTSGAQALGYPVISESNRPEISGTALSLAAFIIMGGGYGLGLPFIGKLLDLFWDGKIVDGIHHYSLEAYHKAFVSIPIGILIAIIFIFFIKETRGRAIFQKD